MSTFIQLQDFVWLVFGVLLIIAELIVSMRYTDIQSLWKRRRIIYSLVGLVWVLACIICVVMSIRYAHNYETIELIKANVNPDFIQQNFPDFKTDNGEVFTVIPGIIASIAISTAIIASRKQKWPAILANGIINVSIVLFLCFWFDRVTVFTTWGGAFGWFRLSEPGYRIAACCLICAIISSIILCLAKYIHIYSRNKILSISLGIILAVIILIYAAVALLLFFFLLYV